MFDKLGACASAVKPVQGSGGTVSGGYKMMFLFGVLLGMITGVMVMALMAVARDDDDRRNDK